MNSFCHKLLQAVIIYYRKNGLKSHNFFWNSAVRKIRQFLNDNLIFYYFTRISFLLKWWNAKAKSSQPEVQVKLVIRSLLFWRYFFAHPGLFQNHMVNLTIRLEFLNAKTPRRINLLVISSVNLENLFRIDVSVDSRWMNLGSATLYSI